jgi:hypothetical protein
MWLATIGDWDVEHWENTAGWSWSSVGGGESNQPLLGLAIFALFTFVVVIVLLNLLIAILSETFDRVMESTGRVTVREKLAITMDVEASARCITLCCRAKFNARFEPTWYPSWVHVLRPKGQNTEDADAAAQGAVRLLKLKLQVKKLDVMVERRFDKLAGIIGNVADRVDKLEQMQRAADDNVREMKGELARVVEELKGKLARVVEDAMKRAFAAHAPSAGAAGAPAARAEQSPTDADKTAAAPAPDKESLDLADLDLDDTMWD